MKRILLAFGMLLALIGLLPQTSSAQVSVGVAVTLAPPPLPVYTQPPLPGPGYIWTPGYWAWGPEGYYWIPGTWVLAPAVGLLWTPGYWAWGPSGYFFHVGYWGPRVGFYGGINYGFGYGGTGYQGGRWDHGQFAYNRSVTHITNTTVIHNVYDEHVTNVTQNRVSFNGGNGGVPLQANAEERAYAAESHTPATSAQQAHFQAAANDRSLLANVNHGAPAIAATARPGALHEPGVVRSAPANGGARPAPQAHAPAQHAQAMHQAAPHPAPHPEARPAQHGGGGGHDERRP
jgi:hypothetical protein